MQLRRLQGRIASGIVGGAVLVAPLAWGGEGWPGLRGPDFDGGVRNVELFEGGQASLKTQWSRQLGSGYSAVAVGEGRAVTMFAAGEMDILAAYDAESGDELWRYPVAETYDGHDGSHDGPISTPLLAAGRVFGLAPRGELFALDATTGKPLWTRHAVEDFGGEKPYYGFSTSPVLAGNVLVIALGGGDGKAFAGIDAATGDLKWTLGDGPIHYQSPVLAEIGGHETVLAASSSTLYGIDAKTGTALWSYVHDGDEHCPGGGALIPVPAGDDRVLLLNRGSSSVMVQVAKKGKVLEATELWSGKSLGRTFAHPVVHEGYIYGMVGRIFTCIDAATGEAQWKSREPGDGFPTLVGNHVVMITKPGSLHVIEASPKGYQEVASLDLFTEHSWSAVAYADGHLYARSMARLAKIDPVRADSVVAEAPSWVATTAFGNFLAGLETAADKKTAIDRYLAQQESFPLVEPSGAVHFIYRGEAEDVGIVGDMIGYRREDPMTRVEGTDLFYYSSRLEPDAAVVYGFIPNYESALPDPRNPKKTKGLFGDVSWFSMPGWSEPGFLEEAAEPYRGRLETLEWESGVHEGEKHKAQVYLPAIYDSEPDRRFPTAYFLGGKAALEAGQVPVALDNLLGKSVEPLIAVFVLPPEEASRESRRDQEGNGKILAMELVSRVDASFRTRPERFSRAVAGVDDAGNMAYYVAFNHSEVFGKLAAQSPSFLNVADGESLIGNPLEQDLVIYHAWGTYDLRSPHEAWDMGDNNRQIFQILRQRGYRPTGGESPEGFGWVFWRGHTDDWLRAFFPLVEGSG